MTLVVSIKRSVANELPSRHESVHFKLIPDELLIKIAGFLLLCDLSHFALSYPHLTDLLFNQQPSKFKQLSIGKEEAIEEKDLPENFKSEEGPEFERVQQLIWKSLVCYYFPNFVKTLNIKNWMHVLRRRVAHLKLYYPHCPSLRILPTICLWRKEMIY